MENQPSDPGRVGGLPEGFRLVRELSRDGSSVVYLADDLARGGQVTLTALGRLGEPSSLPRLAHEMDAVSSLRHPNILPVRAVGGGEGRAFLVSPHTEDPDLRQRLAAWGPLPVPTALQIVGQLADALDAAHRVGVVHGEVRPGVVRFAAGTGQPYLTGFGASVAQASDAATIHATALEHVAPEQVRSAPVGPRTDVYAVGGLLFRCLTGIPPFRGFGPGGVLAEIQQADPPRASAYRPELPGELDQVLATAMAKDPAYRYGTCRAVVDAAAAAVGMGAMPAPHQAVAPRRRRIGLRIVLAVLVVAALAAGGVVVAPYVVAALQPTSEDLARVPVAVRDNCQLASADARLTGSQRLLRCTGDGQEVLVGLFGDEGAADAAFRGLAASNPVVRSGEGDCARTTGWEHPYPGVGESQGRVLCDRAGSAARLAWVDRASRTMSVAERADGNAIELYRTWSRWVGQPTFPTPAERELQDDLLETSCQRAPAGLLDGLDGVIAAVECVPVGTGAGTVYYYRFTDQESMQRAYDSDVARSTAPSAGGVVCADEGVSGGGEGPYPIRDIDAGRLLCTTDETGGGHTVTWTTDVLRILARATGPDRAALGDWWFQSSGPRLEAVVDAVNQQSTPPFPTAQESALLQQIPSASRTFCVRPGPDLVRSHVGDATVVAVYCTATNGPANALYYGFADAAALNAAIGPVDGSDCTTLPPGSFGAAPYARPDGSTGVLACGAFDTGQPYLAWTDDQTRILGVGIDADPALLIPWWQTEAGPL